MIMKSFLFNLIVVTLFVCLTAKYGSCLRCYECDNFGSSIYDDSVCKDVNPSMIRHCPDSDEDTVCRTLRGDKRLDDYDGTFTIIKRSCGKLKFENVKKIEGTGKYKGDFQDGVAVSSMVCNTDLCNGAVDICFSKMLLFISAVLSVSFFICVY